MGHGGRIAWVRLVLGGLLGLAIAAALGVLIGPLVVAQIKGGGSLRIQDDAMAPALLPGDWVLAEPLFPGQAPARGTIVIYAHPTERNSDAVMRVIGLPGERIQMRGGAVYIDGVRATMDQLDDRVIRKRPAARRASMPMCINDPVELDGACHQEVWRETLPGGFSGTVLNARRKIGLAIPAVGGNSDDTKIFTIPGDSVFLIGDNRDDARDSRFSRHGAVPIHKLKHQVTMIHTSLDRTARFITPRWERFFLEVE